MKAVLIAAGEGTRMRPLTYETPKQLLRIHGKTLLEYVLEALPAEISEIIMVIGYKGEQIQNFLGNEWRGKPVRYVWQEKPQGTAPAISLAKDALRGEKFFLAGYADDVHGAQGVAACVAQSRPCFMVAEAANPRKFGVIETDAAGKITTFEEKPEYPKSNLVSSGFFVLPVEILDYPVPPRENGEEYIPDRVVRMMQDGYEFYTERSTQWIPIGYPEDLQRAEGILCPKK
ncbi:MAG: Nucleotidyl transferase [Parcubacteria group bacterium Gr01-1014_29]|nr:MAG: Nucleotidyl transferase [Parcubacteria group bacterium Gr01-1014_29]